MTKQPNYVFDDELYHHGIKGQHWGDRRFQNEDGSWTPEGRERYGKGGRLFQIFKRNKSEQQIKADEQKAKAKISYNTQKYKADLKLKAQKDKIARAAKEEREKIKQQAKSDAVARKEQNKLDKKQAKLDSNLAKEKAKASDTATLKEKMNRTKKYSMSDEELSKAIERLKLESEYNKQYALASKPNSALARADRFFEGPTGKAVLDLSKSVLPAVATAATNKILDSRLKYANQLDRDKAQADIDKSKSEAEKNRALADSSKATAEKTRQSSINETNESNVKVRKEENDIAVNRAKAKGELLEQRHRVEREDRESENEAKLARSKQLIETNKARQEMKYQKMSMEGYDYDDGGIKRHVVGILQREGEKRALDTIYDNKRMETNQKRLERMLGEDLKDRQLDRDIKTYKTNVEIAKDVDNHAISLMKSLASIGKTQAEIAEQTGLSISTVNKYLKKK